MTGCSMQLSQAAEVLGAKHEGADVMFQGVSTDTRSLQKGQLFIALHGENFDAHDFLSQAEAGGAVAAVVSQKVEAGMPVLLVEDTQLALGQLAGAWRSQFAIPVIAVTGSNGKTTVKEMIASILQMHGQPLVTQGNLNNEIGVPLTLLRMNNTHSHAVIEMGASHIGEIAYLASLAQPDVGVVTNAMSAHLEGFGSLDGVAQGKGEMFDALMEGATAIINADDRYANDWRGRAAPAQILSFGLHQQADVSASNIEFDVQAWQTRFTLHTPQGETDISLPFVGEHNVMNALAAAAASQASGMSLDVVRDGLQQVRSVSGRLRAQTSHHGALVIDDSYNANPDSLQAGLDVLEMLPGKRILVIGDMAELGSTAAALHTRIAAQAREAGVQFLFAIGDESRVAVERFGNGAQHFASHAELLTALARQLDDNSVVLVKGSRRMRMEKIVEGLLGE